MAQWKMPNEGEDLPKGFIEWLDSLPDYWEGDHFDLTFFDADLNEIGRACAGDTIFYNVFCVYKVEKANG